MPTASLRGHARLSRTRAWLAPWRRGSAFRPVPIPLPAFPGGTESLDRVPARNPRGPGDNPPAAESVSKSPSAASLCSAQNQLNGPHHAVELLRLVLQLPAALGGEPVKPRLAVAFVGAPLGGQPALDEHAVEGRVERPVFDRYAVAGGCLHVFDNVVAVRRPGAQRAQDQQVESAGQQSGTGAFRRRV